MEQIYVQGNIVQSTSLMLFIELELYNRTEIEMEKGKEDPKPNVMQLKF